MAKTFHIAAETGDIERVREMISRGRHVDYPDNFGRTALFRAAQGNAVAMVKVLIRLGADVNATAFDKQTALHRATVFGRMESAKLLIEHGANPNAKDCNGNSPLDLASDATKEKFRKIFGLRR